MNEVSTVPTSNVPTDGDSAAGVSPGGAPVALSSSAARAAIGDTPGAFDDDDEADGQGAFLPPPGVDDDDAAALHARQPDPWADAPTSRRTARGDGWRGRAGGPLPPDDPFWTFGTPVESWGRSVRRPPRQQPADAVPAGGRERRGGPGGGAPSGERRPVRYLECRSCGVKLERKAAHGAGRVPCPMCGQPLVGRS